jgi:hypothetical protein
VKNAHKKHFKCDAKKTKGQCLLPFTLKSK